MVKADTTHQAFADAANIRSTCQILITNNSPIDTRGKEPDERFDTALRVVDVSGWECVLYKC